MAILLGQKPLIDTKAYNDYALGLKLPIQLGGTGFDQNYYVIDQVKSNIKNLLITKKGERVMQPEFGSGLQELLFEFEDDSLQDRIETVISNSISRWIPNVDIQEISVDMSNELKDKNQANVKLVFKIRGTNNSGVLDLNLKQQQI